jgi:hypothetical protein
MTRTRENFELSLREKKDAKRAGKIIGYSIMLITIVASWLLLQKYAVKIFFAIKTLTGL